METDELYFYEKQNLRYQNQSVAPETYDYVTIPMIRPKRSNTKIIKYVVSVITVIVPWLVTE